MAYASSSSPFAAVKGQNIFSSNKATSPPPLPPMKPAATPVSPFIISPNEPSGSSLTFTPLKRSGFEAFASSTSPFSSATRSKSPILGSTSKLGRAKSPPRRGNPANSSAFSLYAGGVQSFAVPAQKRAKASSPTSSSRSSLERTPGVSTFGSNGAGLDSGPDDDDRSVSFGEKLRAGRNDEEEGQSDEEQAKITLTEQDGTLPDRTLWHSAHLTCPSINRGGRRTNCPSSAREALFLDGRKSVARTRDRDSEAKRPTFRWGWSSPRYCTMSSMTFLTNFFETVMRKEAVYALLLNVTLFHGMRCSLAQDPRYLRFSVIEEGSTTHYNLRVGAQIYLSSSLREHRPHSLRAPRLRRNSWRRSTQIYLFEV